jgi:iron-sulfur cluster repair protein YtfE (RIC family)
MSRTDTVQQITLPGQAHTAEGPHDQSGMYVMHHAFRRDLARFVEAARRTPVEEAEVWRALEKRWLAFDDVLHHHHQIEDSAFWPPLLAHADAAGGGEDRATLEAMEAEHAVIDPALQRCRDALAQMVSHPCEDHRNALDVRLTSTREALLQHLHHEETIALPLLQRTMTRTEYAAAEAAAQKGYPLRSMGFLIPWVLHELPEEGVARVAPSAPPGFTLLHRLTRGRFLRLERVAFRYA